MNQEKKILEISFVGEFILGSSIPADQKDGNILNLMMEP
jgi:hypothetical protein